MPQNTDPNSIAVTILMSEDELWKAINITAEPLTDLVDDAESIREYANPDQIALLTSAAAQGVHVLLSLLPAPPRPPSRPNLKDDIPF